MKKNQYRVKAIYPVTSILLTVDAYIPADALRIAQSRRRGTGEILRYEVWDGQNMVLSHTPAMQELTR